MPRFLASLGLLLALSLVGSGCLGLGASADDVRGEILKEGLGKKAMCRDAGTDGDGNSVWRCKLTLSGKPTAPELDGKQVTECFSKIKQRDITSLVRVACNLVSPANAGSPSS